MNLIEQLMQESCKLTQSKRKRATESKKSSISRKKVNEDFEYDETSEEDRGIYDWISERVAGDIFYKFWEGFNDSENQDFMEAIGLLVKVYKSMYDRQK